MVWFMFAMVVIASAASFLITDYNKFKIFLLVIFVIILVRWWFYEPEPTAKVIDPNGGVSIQMEDALLPIPSAIPNPQQKEKVVIPPSIYCASLPLDNFLNPNAAVRLRMSQLNAAIACHARTFDIDPLIFLAMVNIESAGFNWRALSRGIHGQYVGAMGLTQVMPDTAKQHCTSESIPSVYRARVIDGRVDRGHFLNSPHVQLNCGARYLKKRIDQFKDTPNLSVYSFVDLNIFPKKYVIAICAYNAGEGRITQYNGCPRFTETTRHIKRIQETYVKYKSYGARMPAAQELGLI